MLLIAVMSALVACAPAGSAAGPTASGIAGAGALGWADTLTGEADKCDGATTVAPITSIARNIGCWANHGASSCWWVCPLTPSPP